MLLSEIRLVATKMARKRGLGEDAEQVAWIAGWNAAKSSNNPRYIARSITNALNQLHRIEAKKVPEVSYDALDFAPEVLMVSDWMPIEMSWVKPVLRDPIDAAIVQSVSSGMRLSEVSRTWGLKRWNTHLKPELQRLWRENNV